MTVTNRRWNRLISITRCCCSQRGAHGEGEEKKRREEPGGLGLGLGLDPSHGGSSRISLRFSPGWDHRAGIVLACGQPSETDVNRLIHGH